MISYQNSLRLIWFIFGFTYCFNFSIHTENEIITIQMLLRYYKKANSLKVSHYKIYTLPCKNDKYIDGNHVSDTDCRNGEVLSQVYIQKKKIQCNLIQMNPPLKKVIYHICDSLDMIEEKCSRKNKIQRTFRIFHYLNFQFNYIIPTMKPTF